jgi:hypothetical protein
MCYFDGKDGEKRQWAMGNRQRIADTLDAIVNWKA